MIKNEKNTNNISLNNQTQIARIIPKINRLSTDIGNITSSVLTLQTGANSTQTQIETLQSTLESQSGLITQLQNQIQSLGNSSQSQTEVWGTSDTYKTSHYNSLSTKDKTNKIFFTMSPGPATLNISFTITTNYAADRTINVYLGNTVIYTESVSLDNEEHTVSTTHTFSCSSGKNYIVLEVVNDITYASTYKTYFSDIDIELVGNNAKFITPEDEFKAHTCNEKMALQTKLLSHHLAISNGNYLTSSFRFDRNNFKIVYEVATDLCNVGLHFCPHYNNSSTNTVETIANTTLYLSAPYASSRRIFKNLTDLQATLTDRKASYHGSNVSADMLSAGTNISTSSGGCGGFFTYNSDGYFYFGMQSVQKCNNLVYTEEPVELCAPDRLGCTTLNLNPVLIVVNQDGTTTAKILNIPSTNVLSSAVINTIELGEGSHPTAYYLSDNSVVIYLNYRNKRIKKVTLTPTGGVGGYALDSTTYIKENILRIYRGPNDVWFLKTPTQWQMFLSESQTTPTATIAYRS